MQCGEKTHRTQSGWKHFRAGAVVPFEQLWMRLGFQLIFFRSLSSLGTACPIVPSQWYGTCAINQVACAATSSHRASHAAMVFLVNRASRKGIRLPSRHRPPAQKPSRARTTSRAARKYLKASQRPTWSSTLPAGPPHRRYCRPLQPFYHWNIVLSLPLEIQPLRILRLCSNIYALSRLYPE